MKLDLDDIDPFALGILIIAFPLWAPVWALGAMGRWLWRRMS